MCMMCSDKPIANCENDLLNRASFAGVLADTIYNIDNKETYTIGLYGKWGNGKTSLVNMMLQNLEKLQENAKKRDQVIVIRFEPWNIVNNEILFNQFFTHLATHLMSIGDKALSKVGSAMLKYSSAFDTIEPKNGLIKFLVKCGLINYKKIGKKLQKGMDETDVFKQKENVEKKLQKTKKRILIVIDDIDRLSNEHIRQVFQLVMSVANFPNVTYLLSFDKDVVVKALEKVQDGDGEEYLEKIVQIPITMPEISKIDLNNILISKLEQLLKEFPLMSFDEKYWHEAFDVYIEPYTNDVRFINRLCNILRFKLTTISTEVNFIDMIGISVLELTSNKVYEWVKKNKVLLTGDDPATYYFFKDKPAKEMYSYYSKIIDGKRGENENISIDNLMMLIGSLFPYFGNKIGACRVYGEKKELLKNNRVGHEDKFDRYFSLDINSIDIKQSLIEQILAELTDVEIAFVLSNQEKSENCYQLLKEIEASIPSLPEGRKIILINALFSVSSKLKDNRKNILNLGLRDTAEMLLYSILSTLSPDLNYKILTEIIERKDEISTVCVSDIINMIELGYGRLSANGTERSYEKIITLEQLEQIEKSFVINIREMLESTSLFSFYDWRMIKHLIKNFDNDFYIQYVQESLKENKNILCFITEYVTEWIGSGIQYELSKGYEEFVSTEQVLSAIEDAKVSGELFEQKEKVQLKCCAFYLFNLGKVNYRGVVIQDECQALLKEWSTSVEICYEP